MYMLTKSIKQSFDDVKERLRLQKLSRVQPSNQLIDTITIPLDDGQLKYVTYPNNVHELVNNINKNIQEETVILLKSEPINSTYDLIIVDNTLDGVHKKIPSEYRTNTLGHQRAFVEITIPSDILHEFGHILNGKDLVNTGLNISDYFDYHDIHEQYKYKIEPYLSELVADKEYYFNKSESWVRIFQQWYENINPNSCLKREPEYFDKSYETANNIYMENKEYLNTYFQDLFPNIYKNSEKYQTLTNSDLPNNLETVL